MPEPVKAVPTGFHTLTPRLTVRDADKVLEFYKNALCAEVLDVARRPHGKVMHARAPHRRLHAHVERRDARIWSTVSAIKWRSRRDHAHLHRNVDAAFDRAVSAGVKVTMPLMDQWGDRYGIVADPFGHKWSIATHLKDMSPEEMRRAQDEAMAKMPPSAAKKTA